MLGFARGEDEGQAGEARACEAGNESCRDGEAVRKKSSHSEVDARYASRAGGCCAAGATAAARGAEPRA